MRGTWVDSVVERLLEAKNLDGGWGYAPALASAAEPTAWASLALSAHAEGVDAWKSGLDVLTRLQRPDGGVPAVDIQSPPSWTTAPAILAWHLAPIDRGAYRERIALGTEWLLSHAGKAVPFNASLYGHDTSLIGWSWVEGTHSWVEPTGYALLALTAIGHRVHSRAIEARKLLLNRMIPGGGWNYGNARMFGAALRPFPGTTGVALLALRDRPADSGIEQSLEFLSRELPSVRSPLSLSWGIMALTAWNRRPASADTWLAETFTRFAPEPCSPLHESLLLLASHDVCPLVTNAETAEATHG
jgi:hypothetical protein